jgi:hypothetical protein
MDPTSFRTTLGCSSDGADVDGAAVTVVGAAKYDVDGVAAADDDGVPSADVDGAAVEVVCGDINTVGGATMYKSTAL